MQIKTLVVGPIETNCYIVTNEDTHECVVIDPGDESNTILDYLESNHLKLSAIMLTHGHFDHVGAVGAILEEMPVSVYMNSKDDALNRNNPDYFPFTLPSNGKYYADGDVIDQAGLTFRIMETPGHTPGSVTIICEDALFPGDTLFRGSCGRTDMDGGDQEEEMRSLKKICSLSGNYDVYPGHMDYSTLDRERMFNYYCRYAMNQ